MRLKLRQDVFLCWVVLFVFGALIAALDVDARHVCPSSAIIKNRLLIQLIDVGQGDATFIRTPSGTTILIDGGDLGQGGNEIVPLLSECFRLTALDYVILTHPHADHYGGLIDILRTFKINKALFDNGISNPSDRHYQTYEELARKSGKRKTPHLGVNTLTTKDPGIEFEFLMVNGQILLDNTREGHGQNRWTVEELLLRDPNALSHALVIRYFDFRYFTAGDLTGGGSGSPNLERPLAPLVGEVDVMKSNHHGSFTANSENFITALKPRHILISVGDGGKNLQYHLPNEHVMALYDRLDFIDGIYQTQTGEGRAPASVTQKVQVNDGDILLTSSGTYYWIDGKRFVTRKK